GRDGLPRGIVQHHNGGTYRLHREFDDGTGPIAGYGELLYLSQPEVGRQVERVDREPVPLPGVEGRHQQQALVVGGAEQAVLQLHRHPGDSVGGNHGEGIVDTAASKDIAAHQHQPATGTGITVPAASGAGDTAVHAAVVAQPARFGEASGIAFAVAGAQAPTQSAVAGDRLVEVHVHAVPVPVALHGGVERTPVAQADGYRKVEAA